MQIKQASVRHPLVLRLCNSGNYKDLYGENSYILKPKKYKGI